MRSPSRGPSPALTARAKVWLESDGEYVFGLGISKILQAVGQEGSIKAAAVVVGKSYRHIWTRIKETEQALGVLLVQTTVGGNRRRRSELTPEGQALAREFDRLRRRVFRLVKRESTSILKVVRDTCDHRSR